jgi:small subunit ribosomal protein S35
MASPASLLRLCLRPSRRLPRLRAAVAQPPALRQTFSTTQWRLAAESDKDAAASSKEAEDDDDLMQDFKDPGEFLRSYLDDDTITPEERTMAKRMLADWKDVPAPTKKLFQTINQNLDDDTYHLRKPVVPKRDTFWNDEEADPDLITDEVGEDDFEEDDILAMGHAKLEEHREMREYARLAVWEMPLLSSKPKPAGEARDPCALLQRERG